MIPYFQQTKSLKLFQNKERQSKLNLIFCNLCLQNRLALKREPLNIKIHLKQAVHEKRAGGDFACEQCGKMLKSKSSLSYHKRSAHTQDYPHRQFLIDSAKVQYLPSLHAVFGLPKPKWNPTFVLLMNGNLSETQLLSLL